MATEPEKVRAGLTAVAILTDTLSVEIWQRLEQDLITAWAQSGPLDGAEREAIWHQLQGLRAVKAKLETMAAVGRDADRKLQQKAKPNAGIPSHYRI